ncbi:MAG: hypothetical protein NC192_10790, partial [Muribaculaceae bacterium]|nr:hypothetical protein [Muribaculaceae bacterium]
MYICVGFYVWELVRCASHKAGASPRPTPVYVGLFLNFRGFDINYSSFTGERREQPKEEGG